MADESVVITWSIENWITIFLMAAGGFMILVLIAQLFHKAKGGAGSATQYMSTPQPVAT